MGEGLSHWSSMVLRKSQTCFFDRHTHPNSMYSNFCHVLNKILKDLGVLYNQNGVYMLYAKYRGLGYDKYRTHTYTSDTTGMQVAKQYLCWTQLGRKFILDLVNSKSAA